MHYGLFYKLTLQFPKITIRHLSHSQSQTSLALPWFVINHVFQT